MPKPSTAGGNAKIKRQGHTTSGAHGSNPMASRKYPKGEPSDLKK